MFNLFSWIRQRSKESFMAGLADAVEELASTEQGDEQEAIQGLRLRLAFEPEQQDKKKGKKSA